MEFFKNYRTWTMFDWACVIASTPIFLVFLPFVLLIAISIMALKGVYLVLGNDEDANYTGW